MPLSFFPFPFFAWLPIQAPYVFFCKKMSPQDYPLLYGSVQILQHHRAARLHLLFDSKGTGALYLEHSFGNNHLNGLWIPTLGMDPHSGNELTYDITPGVVSTLVISQWWLPSFIPFLPFLWPTFMGSFAVHLCRQ